MTSKQSQSEALDCIIIGAGISGLSAALTMSSNGMKVAVLEKGRGLGGRMATRRMSGAILDHGAQFFTARESFLENKTVDMIRNEAVSAWHKNDYGVTRYRGCPGMTSVGKYLAQSLDVRKQHQVAGLRWQQDRWHVHCDNGNLLTGQTLLSTAPMPQSIALIRASELSVDTGQLAELEHIEYKPTIALLVVLKSPSTMQPPGILKFQDHPVLNTITDNQVKGISDVPALTIHSSHSFAEDNLELLNEATAKALISAAREYADFEEEEWALHRWRYAQCVKRHKEDYYRLADYPLWLAGDGFGNARLEQAAMSGIAAASDILEKL